MVGQQKKIAVDIYVRRDMSLSSNINAVIEKALNSNFSNIRNAFEVETLSTNKSKTFVELWLYSKLSDKKHLDKIQSIIKKVTKAVNVEVYE